MIRRYLISLLVVLLVSFNGWSCADTIESLPGLTCQENGKPCEDSDGCCAGYCRKCADHIGVCVAGDGGAR